MCVDGIVGTVTLFGSDFQHFAQQTLFGLRKYQTIHACQLAMQPLLGVFSQFPARKVSLDLISYLINDFVRFQDLF